tara:strand:+ start:3438 stop:5801 length:2364 start_codon:yes stop_codon:yes gene_type:complete
MAYGLRFQDDFFDVDEHKWKLRIYKKDFTGDVENNTLTLGPNAAKVTWEQKNDNFFDPIIGSSCEISMYVTADSGGTFWENEDSNWEAANFAWEETNFDFVAPIDDREYKIELLYAHTGGTATSTTTNKLVDSSATFTSLVKVGDIVFNLTDTTYASVNSIDDANTLTLSSNIFTSGEEYMIYSSYWVGFIIQDQYTLPLKPFPYLINFYASDLIGTLDGYSYAGTTERPNCMEVIKECMKNINEQNAGGDSNAALQLDYQTLCRIKPNTSASDGDPFLQTYIRSKEAMNDENDIAVDCKTILESILQMFNCRMFQSGGKWVIISNDAMALSSYSGTGKVFNNYDYDNVSSSTGTTSLTSPTKNINSSQSNDTIQPMNNDLLKILKRPCVTQRTNIRIKDMLHNEITNGTFESVAAASGSTPSWGKNINNWTVSGGSTSSTEYAVNSTAADTSGWPVVVYGIPPAAGVYSMITIGNEGTAFNTEILKNTTGSIDNIGGNIIFKFSHYAYDPSYSASTALNYSIRYQFKVGSYYWNNSGQEWTTNATNGRNTIIGSVAQEWIENTVTMSQPPVSGALEIIYYRSEEDAYSSSNFRMYFDNVIILPETASEYFSTKVNITKAPYVENSGVIKTFDNRFGQLQDIIYSNALVNSSGTAITHYTYFDNTIISSVMQLETMMNVLRLNDLAESNDLFEGTFRKVNTTAINPSGNRVNSLTPIDMLTKPKMNFTSISGLNNELAIDRLTFEVTKNRYSLNTHTPKNISNETAVNSTSDIVYNRNFYQHKPETD